MKVILSCSIKGGVGKTTVAVHTALALARRGFKVGILDLDYRAPCVPIMLDGENATLQRGEGDVLIPATVQGLSVMSMAYIWPPYKCVTVEDTEAMEQVAELLVGDVLKWPEDQQYLILDTPPTSSGIIKVALELSQASGALVISHPSRVSLADTVRTMDLFSEKQVPIYGLISNQGTDEERRQRYDLTDQHLEELAKHYKLPLFFSIPHTPTLEPYFDDLIAIMLQTTPILLEKPKEPGDVVWRKLVQLSRVLTKSEPRSAPS